jgi:hypothetical protein
MQAAAIRAFLLLVLVLSGMSAGAAAAGDLDPIGTDHIRCLDRHMDTWVLAAAMGLALLTGFLVVALMQAALL